MFHSLGIFIKKVIGAFQHFLEHSLVREFRLKLDNGLRQKTTFNELLKHFRNFIKN